VATQLQVPISQDVIRSLRVGDEVALSGVILTGRDAAHKYMVETFIRSSPPESEQPTYQALQQGLRDSGLYHCGPVVRKRDDGTYEFVSAGPTTSIREEPYEADVIAHFGVRAVIGKGGMGERTLQACREHGAVYLHAIGGAATLIAETVKEVLAVHKLEFGVPEAIWVIRVENFPAVVTMDSHGHSLHADVKQQSQQELERLLSG